MDELPAIITGVLIANGILFLASQYLMLSFWLWRRHRWKSSAWSGWLGVGWLLFLVGFVGNLSDRFAEPAGIYFLCNFGSVICLLIAFVKYHWQSVTLAFADRSLHSQYPPNLRETLQVDPAAKRFIQTCYLLTGGLTLVFCLSMLGTAARRREVTLRNQQQVVSMVQHGTLHANAMGDIALPRDLAGASANGHVYLGHGGSEPGKGVPVVFFPTSVKSYYVDWEDGKPDEKKYQMEGYIYAANVLPRNAGVDFPNPHINELLYLETIGHKSGWYYAMPWESD